MKQTKTKVEFQSEIEQAMSIAKSRGVSNALLNNYVIVYSFPINSKDETEDSIIEWKKLTIPKAMFERIGFAAHVKNQTRRLKTDGYDVDIANVSELLKMISESSNIILLNEPNAYRKEITFQNEIKDNAAIVDMKKK